MDDRGNTQTDLPDESSLTVSFDNCSHGWIYFTCASSQSSVTIHATYLSDPFPDMMQWLKQIIAGSQCSQWSIDEEGRFVNIAFTRTEGEIGTFTATDQYRPERQVTIDLSRRSLVRAFYCSFRVFVESPAYNSAEWHYPGDPEYGENLLALRSAAVENWLNPRIT